MSEPTDPIYYGLQRNPTQRPGEFVWSLDLEVPMVLDRATLTEINQMPGLDDPDQVALGMFITSARLACALAGMAVFGLRPVVITRGRRHLLAGVRIQATFGGPETAGREDRFIAAVLGEIAAWAALRDGAAAFTREEPSPPPADNPVGRPRTTD